MDINLVVPYEKNPRINEDAVKHVADSIREFGFRVPIVVDGYNVIIAGHTRLKAAKQLQLQEVPIIRVVDLTDEQVRALRIADNKTSEFAEWDYKLLLEELEMLKDNGYGIENTGFNEEEYLLMIEDVSSSDDPVLNEDFDIDKELEKIQTSSVTSGQVYRLGKHYLMCGDSTSEDDVKKLMAASGKLVKANMVWTDPPYNVNYEDESGRKILNDNMGDSEFKEFLNKVFSNYFKFTEDNCAFYICYASSEHINFENSMKENDILVRSQIIWVKNVSTFGFASYKWRHEPILYAAKKKGSLKFYGDRKNTTVWRDLKKDDVFGIEAHGENIIIKVKSGEEEYSITVDNIKNVEVNSTDNNTVWEVARESNYVHPNQKPIELIRKAVRNSSRPGDVLLELFGGSGSTLITCEQTNRVCYCMELDPVYAKIIIRRYEDLTGDKAELIND